MDNMPKLLGGHCMNGSRQLQKGIQLSREFNCRMSISTNVWAITMAVGNMRDGKGVFSEKKYMIEAS